MELKKTLSERLGVRDIKLLCHTCCGQDGDMVKSELFWVKPNSRCIC